MSLIGKFMRGAAPVYSRALLDEHKADIMAEKQKRLMALKAQLESSQPKGQSSTLAEVDYLNQFEGKEREERKKELMNLKRGGFTLGGQRFDASSDVTVGIDETAPTEQTFQEAGERGKLEAKSDLEPMIAFDKQNAKQKAETVKATFEELNRTAKSMALYDQAIAEIDAGAKSGAIQKFLPSMRESSIRLDNVADQLGLNILSTFKGSQTEKELVVSFDIAVPKSLDEDDLREWLVDQKEKQQRAAEILREAVNHFESQGSFTGWLEKRENLTSDEEGNDIDAEINRLRSQLGV